MERQKIKINGEKILISLFRKYKNESWVLSVTEIEEKKKSWFPGKWKNYELGYFTHIFGLKSGVTISQWGDVFFLIDEKTSVNRKFETLKDIRETFLIHDSNSIKITRFGTPTFIQMSNSEIQFLQEFLDKFSFEVDKLIEFTQNEKEKNKQQKIEEKQQKLESLKKSKTSVLKEFDKDGIGIMKIIKGSDDFMILFKKHQKKIIDVDKKYIQSFVKISNYIKTKRQNIQNIYLSIKNIKDESQLGEISSLLKNQIHTYQLLIFHSLSMITSVVEEDLITFYEIYESFDKLNIFNSNWENEVSEQLFKIEVDLVNIGEGLKNLMYSINSMEKNIIDGLSQLNYFTQEGFKELNISVIRELQSIDSSIMFNNLLTGISTYQLYKINKQTKGFIK